MADGKRVFMPCATHDAYDEARKEHYGKPHDEEKPGKPKDELEEMGMIGNKKPKMICVQAEGSSPLVDAFEKDEEYATPFVNPKTLAAGMRVPLAVGDFIIFDIFSSSS